METIIILSAVSGLASHWFYFLNGEHHLNAPFLFYFYLLLSSIIIITEIYLEDVDRALTKSISIFLCYLGSLFGSILVYRTCFHRLKSFPGPFLARTSKLWHSWKVRKSTNHVLMQELYEKYGTFVRTGPAELTIFSAEALHAIDCPGSRFMKPDWYDNILPMKSLINIRNPEEHDFRKRIWEPGFTPKALRSYETRIRKYAEQLDQYLETTSGAPIHCNNWFNFYSFDVMGDLAFGKSFNMLIEEKWHHSLIMMRKFMSFQGPFSPVPWLCRLGFSIPGLANDWSQFKAYCRHQMRERISKSVPLQDISSYLIDASLRNNRLEDDLDFLDGDSLAMIIAGSDSTATTLTCIFYHLAKNPKFQQQLQEELGVVPSLQDFNYLETLPVLRSIILETLRLFPPVPTAPARLSPPGGVSINGNYIPEGIAIFTPRYVIARLESCFEKPNEFIPERWTSNPELIKDKRAWAPFSKGRYGCIGKALARKNLAYVTANIISKYDVEFAPGDDGSRFWDEMKDDFTVFPGRLDLVFKLREYIAHQS